MSASAAITFSASVPLLNWTGETLTASWILPGQLAASLQAVVSTHSPSWLIRPVSSASGMNSAGEIMPRCGWRQRTSASQPVIALVCRLETGLVVDLEAAVDDRLAQIHFQAAAGADLGVHLGFEEAIGAAAGGLGRVHRQIRVLQDLVEIGAVAAAPARCRCWRRWSPDGRGIHRACGSPRRCG